MAYRNLYRLIIFFLVLSSCRKDPLIIDPALNYEQPCSYFPAHPGTWWVYDQNEGQVTYEIAERAEEVYMNTNNSNYLPYFKNLNCHISGCDFYHWNSTMKYGPMKCPIVLESIVSFSMQSLSAFSVATMSIDGTDCGGPYTPYRRDLFAIDTTITNLNGQTFDNVLIMKERKISDTTHYYLEYFAKDIGLVKLDSINMSDSTNLIEILTLNEYFINK